MEFKHNKIEIEIKFVLKAILTVIFCTINNAILTSKGKFGVGNNSGKKSTDYYFN